MEEQQGSDAGSPWARPPAAEPTRPLWLDPPTSPPLAESPAGPPPPPPSPPNPFPASSVPPPSKPAKERKDRSSTGWLKPAIAGGIVGAIVAAGVAGGIVAARDDGTTTTAVPAALTRSSSKLAGEHLDVAGVLQKVQHGVVAIEVKGTSNGVQSFEAAGTGMIIDSAGLILTNSHVVENATSIQVSLYDGTKIDATLVGRSSASDVALIQAHKSGLEPVKFGSSKALQVGDDVVAVGNALNLGATPTVTTGIVSALDRDISADNGESLSDLIQTDAAINHGNSGGPLVNALGEVVGINTAVAAEGQNIGFAISIDSIQSLIEKLRNGGGDFTSGAFLGVTSSSVDNVVPQAREQFGITADSGAFVTAVVPGSAADSIGLQPGDVITEIDGRSVKTNSDVRDIILSHKPGDQVEIRYQRDGEPKSGRATLGAKEVEQAGG